MPNLTDIKRQVSELLIAGVPKNCINLLLHDFKYLSHYLSLADDALIEPGEDPEVIRAKYFIRDEFLVSLLQE